MTTNTDDANGYTTVTIYTDASDPRNPGWAYRAHYDNGRTESGEVDCEVDATPSEAVTGWLEEHVRGGLSPTRVVSNTDGSRTLVWQ